MCTCIAWPSGRRNRPSMTMGGWARPLISFTFLKTHSKSPLFLLLVKVFQNQILAKHCHIYPSVLICQVKLVHHHDIDVHSVVSWGIQYQLILQAYTIFNYSKYLKTVKHSCPPALRHSSPSVLQYQYFFEPVATFFGTTTGVGVGAFMHVASWGGGGGVQWKLQSQKERPSTLQCT